MEPSGSYPQQPRHHLFQSPQLPPPSQLHLPSFSRSNTLPPIPHIPHNSHQNHRFSPISPYSTSGGSPSILPPLPSPTSAPTQQSWPSLHNTSNSREEMHPSLQHQHHQPRRRNDSRADLAIKSEVHSNHPSMAHLEQQHSPSTKESEDGMPATSDFVKKLYKMLEDQTFTHVVSWGPHGDCFVVKDMNEFTKSILPRMFKHSNFASFVRQLNKYDFHKVKNTDDNQFGEHSWTFRHPDFHADRRDALENIKRKVPTQRKSSQATTARSGAVSADEPGSYVPSSATSATVDALQAQVDRLTQSQEEMAAHMRNLERNYQDVLVEVVNFQRNMAQQDMCMQNLITYFMQVENGNAKEQSLAGIPAINSEASDHNPFLPSQEVQRMMGSYAETDVARASLVQMNEISRRAEVAGMSFGDTANGENNVASGSGTQRPPSAASKIFAAAAGLMTPVAGREEKVMSRQDALARIEEFQRSRPGSAQGGGGGGGVGMAFGGAAAAPPAPSVNGTETFGMNGTSLPAASGSGNGGGAGMEMWGGADIQAVGGVHQGLQVYTLGHLMPRSTVDHPNGNWSFDPNGLGPTLPGPVVGNGGTEGQGESGDFGAPGPSTSEPPPLAGASTSASEGVPPDRPDSSQKLRVRRSTFVPGWAVPPRVLLVDDDAVNRKLSSKYLQVFGCTIDVAVDGQVAVDKMNLDKYDLVLMDIVMPKLDGITATSLIRQFDNNTPIISMTSNSNPTEVLSYMNSGMNDVLPKPFTKDGLLGILEKHLMHLKVIQQMSNVPRSIGIPPLNDPSFEQALTVQATTFNHNPIPMEDDGRINPLAGMGLSDEQYATILQNLVNGQSFTDGMGGEKRPLEEDGDGRDGKRSRFEVLE